jgi:uroporphyrin-III C-methyltransferase
MVYLIGAGPGDPDLITLAGLKALRHADAVVYDALIAAELLEYARPGAELYDVGKRAGQHSMKQTEINDLLIDLASQGKSVARLKGGDPFVFGRGGEEMEALIAAGIPCKVIPGVSSAVAVPALAGVPLTHRGLSASFAVFTAHRAEGTPELNWASLAGIDTLVVMMGGARLAHVAEKLIAAGRDPETPAICIEWGTTPRQREVVAQLHEIALIAEEAGISTPVITVIGEVVAMRSLLYTYPHILSQCFHEEALIGEKHAMSTV